MSAGRLARLRARGRIALAEAVEDLTGRTRPGPDGLPLPPAGLMRRVSGASNAAWFLSAGRAGAEDVAAALARAGGAVDRLGRALDFGCGCGRVLRHLAPWAAQVELHGCDAQGRLARWSARHLSFAHVVRNRPAPPLPYPDAHFGFAWAFSVFTHLPEPLERAWLAELARVLRPGGLLLLSLHGAENAAALGTAERAAFERGERITVGARHPGSNACNAFHPERYVRDVLARGWRLVEWRPSAARGNPPQDLVLLARPADQ